MRIYAKVTPRAARNEVVKISDAEYRVKVAAPPEKGKANEAVVEMLAEYFDVSKSQIDIIAGRTAKIKIIDVQE